jgi:regulator of protease activity HflC (stomatin/prohibitin superfamily)
MIDRLKERFPTGTPAAGAGSRPRFPFFVIPLGVVALLLAAAVFIGLPRQVDASQNCIVLKGGAYSHTAGKGWEFVSPFLESLQCFPAQRLTYEAVGPKPNENIAAAINSSDADYKEQAPDARSNDPQRIEYAPYRIVFEVPDKLPLFDDNFRPVMEDTNGDGDGDNPVYLREDNVAWVYANIGHSMDDVVRRVVSTHSRPLIRQNLGLYSAEFLFKTDLAAEDGVQDTTFEELHPLFLQSGVVLRELLISKPDFNDPFEERLNEQQLAVRDTEIARQNALKAEQEGQARINAAIADAQVAEEAARGSANAEIETAKGEAAASVERARGAAEANVVQKEAEAEGIRLVADAQAEQQRLLVEAYGGPEFYARNKQSEAMGQWQITTILGNDAGVLPVMPLSEIETEP